MSENNTMEIKIFNNLLYTIVIVMILFMVFSVLEQCISSCIDVRQGMYLSQGDMKNICIGMKKNEIFSSFGSPVIYSLFESNVCYYVYYHMYGNKILNHQILKLTFDLDDILIRIND
ncbi:outer membrane protein assembly factor BamE [Candidatus Blochmannia ocreatus (nom. nud.)]|uniref:Outer membrane protein assembly factor BamE n=1 Tax=Candidatus Blochmannia ocreatus (nom. nud.) TaxID=251538 RepID=A0ABY4SSS3_9ENTR|nr:outer membrane protein assembly factor BamE [Candidatus Blochmannia ocreatus]URJ25025.1 outer membrane protein assembly factor BamE [Candidatus Blochmannia ocreatus]